MPQGSSAANLIAVTNINYSTRLLQYSLRVHPVLAASFVLGLVTVPLELLAVSSLFPLSVLAAGNRVDASSLWVAAVGIIGLQPDFRGFVILFALLMTVRLLGQFWNQVLASYLGKRIQGELSARAFDVIVSRFSLREIEEKTIGHFIALAGDETSRAGTIVTTLLQLTSSLMFTGLCFVSIAYLSPSIAVAVVVFILVSLVSLRGAFARSANLGELLLAQAKRAHSVFLDTLNGLRSVRCFSAERYVGRQYSMIIRDYTRTLFKLDFLSQISKLIPALILLVGLVFLGAFSVYRPSGPSELAFAITILGFLVRFFPASGQTLNLALRLNAETRSAKDVMTIIDQTLENRTEPAKGALTSSRIESIELRNVGFAYRDGHPVLKNLNVKFVAGRSYAVVGPSGAGKSTVLDLILKFHSTSSGTILLNGVDLRDLADSDVRHRAILLGQQTTILNDTVGNNVRFGLEADESEVMRACELACLDDVIGGLPSGLHTVLQYQGTNLSGGQRQRIGIARALLRSADVLILDESTSALDAETRNRIVAGILGLYSERIVIFSTHDPQIAEKVDEIIDLSAHSSRPGQSDVEMKR